MSERRLRDADVAAVTTPPGLAVPAHLSGGLVLTGWDIEALGFFDEDDYLCRPCAVKRYSTIRIEKVEHGLADKPEIVTRYELVSSSYDWGFDRALGNPPDFGVEHRVDRFVAEHPALAEYLSNPFNRTQLELRVAYREGIEHCYECGKRLTPRWSEPDPDRKKATA